MDKSNIVLLGPSGSGKTYLTQSMCDCTTLTQAGYVGEDVETVIQKLLSNAHGSVERAQQGIVFLDEFDKIHSSSDPVHSVGNRDVSGRGVQQALLKLVEGTVAKVKMPGQMGHKVDVDTTNILFIASGAFSNLEQIVARRIDKRVLGFGATFANIAEDLASTDESIAAEKRNQVLQQIDQSDLMQFGMVPELVGRFPVLVPFHALDEKMLIRVLQEPRNSLISQAQRFFAMDSIQLRFTRGAINELARRAVQRKTGARALRSILESVLLQPKFECPGTGVHTVVITGSTVRGESDYLTMSTSSNKSPDSVVPTDSAIIE
ncbi:putative ATP-dependent Clp protease, ATP-binding subunit ClpX [Cooperia oncophora]